MTDQMSDQGDVSELQVQGVRINVVAPNIMRIDYGTVLVTADLIEDILTRTTSVWGDRPFVIMSVVYSASNLARIARVQESDRLAAVTKAIGVVTRSRVAIALGNAFQGIARTPYPIRLFRSEAEALPWLEKQAEALLVREEQ